ncbi:MAG TPA: hypothetical protein ENK11_06750 [Phycisphaerales bacterium]|nr:hypothetical protein [Phycisphaerales bacterium]
MTDAHPLALALAAQADAQINELARARGLGRDTFDTLVHKATGLLEFAGDDATGTADIIRDHRGVLRAVARLIDDPAADEIPPSNDEVYAAVLDITELDSITSALGRVGSDRLLRHLIGDDPAGDRRDRLGLSFAAVCARAGLPVEIDPGPSGEAGVVGVTLDRWPIAAAAAVPLAPGELEVESRRAGEALRRSGRPGLIVLEAGMLLDWSPINVADDATAVAIMNERLDALMIGVRDRVADAAGTDHAFGLVLHATLPALNAASRRMLFAECLRAVNLCDADDPRIHGFQTFITALGKADAG